MIVRKCVNVEGNPYTCNFKCPSVFQGETSFLCKEKVQKRTLEGQRGRQGEREVHILGTINDQPSPIKQNTFSSHLL